MLGYNHAMIYKHDLLDLGLEKENKTLWEISSDDVLVP